MRATDGSVLMSLGELATENSYSLITADISRQRVPIRSKIMPTLSAVPLREVECRYSRMPGHTDEYRQCT